MPQRDQEIAMLRREIEMLMGERQALLHVVGASAALIAAVAARRAAWQAETGTPAPIDAVTASASGLDPDVSPETALAQAGRIAA